MPTIHVLLLRRQLLELMDGAAMESLLSSVMANLYMEHLDQIALQSSSLKPKKRLRCVDEVWVGWLHGRDAK